ncbi:MAG: hypothetical protein TECD_01133 [Hyphomicrobiaceae bacterium hypho_1]
MNELNELYSTRLLALANNIPYSQMLDKFDSKASAHSKLCGSSVTVEIQVQDYRIINFGQTVKACLLCQASAAIIGQNIIGTAFEEFRDVARQMRSMLKHNGIPPSGRWTELALLMPVRPYKSRHTSTLLVFDALEKAIDAIE